MGEVYRATDTHLGRQVAIKVLPEAFAQDAERLARFEREAKTLAALNHPHIAAIYGFEKSGGANALVMELVEGPTLAELLERRAGPSGPAGLPIDEALSIATQIAEALEAAHEQGDHPPRSQARQHQGPAGRHGESARFRVGQGDGAGIRFVAEHVDGLAR